MGLPRIAVAMSGGVDSSVAALLLKQEGYEVFGITMQLYDSTGIGPSRAIASHRCCGVEDIADARAVAAHLDIPYYVTNQKELFERTVVDGFVGAYAAGTTPIPCIECNRTLKFDHLLSRCLTLGAVAMATGHYARIEPGPEGPRLLKGVDPSRDQSYYLYSLTRSQLETLRFPLGGLDKDEVRERARSAGLPVAEKPDSQEICFVPNDDYASFVETRRTFAPGEIRDGEGRRLGSHQGIHRFTVGQRRGLGISGNEPRYVTEIQADTQTVVVGSADELLEATCRVSGVSWVGGTPSAPVRARVRIRSRHEAAPAVIGPEGRSATVEFDEPQRGITPGQAAVFYRDDEVLGGGTITGAGPGR